MIILLVAGFMIITLLVGIALRRTKKPSTRGPLYITSFDAGRLILTKINTLEK